jgi:hypothetical protein
MVSVISGPRNSAAFGGGGISSDAPGNNGKPPLNAPTQANVPVLLNAATHSFYPCREVYGDTVARTFDYVDRWISTAGRF